MKVSVVSLKLKTERGVVTLSIDEAKCLHEMLNKLFVKEVQYIPSQPIIIERETWPWRPYQPYWTATASVSEFQRGTINYSLVTSPSCETSYGTVTS